MEEGTTKVEEVCEKAMADKGTVMTERVNLHPKENNKGGRETKEIEPGTSVETEIFDWHKEMEYWWY